VSYLSTALNRLAGLQGLSQSDLVRASRLSRSHVSRLFAGEPNHLADHHFVALLKCFGRDPRHQSELVAARCLDVRVGPGADRVRVTIDPDPAASTAAEATPHSALHDPHSNAFPSVPLPAETERAIAWLRGQCPVNPDLEQHLISYARLTGMR
jgi:transcriptional regulator with XRE-family HTH domain